ncbi:hypothetical protein JAO75_11460 [Microvirga sp. BT325]|uniref:Uncharacterized protein n=2 Tax=Microvirga splendida TaxID=2795727 RepID=A0ABS0Y142_9HYPH|nr:hypothetical protein [Microvirga splendida]
MRRDDPRWQRSWWQKPCLVFEVSEERARSVAYHYFSTLEGGLPAALCGHPWDDPDLVICEERQVMGEAPGTSLVTNLAGEAIDRTDSEAP